MASLQASMRLLSSSSSCPSNRIIASISVPKLPKPISFSPPKKPHIDLVEEIKIRDDKCTNSIPVEKIAPTKEVHEQNNDTCNNAMVTAQLYAILEAVADRVEMHNNIGKQRDNWNTLLLNSINMITLTAATMAGVAATGGGGVSLVALKLSSTLLFSAATGMLVMVNKIQPSQLAEEQRNATRLFKQLQSHIQTVLAQRAPNKEDVKEAVEKVLALDQAYPLPLLGKMIEKFPKNFEPAVWWPTNHSQRSNKVDKIEESGSKMEKNGWNEELKVDMRGIVEVLKRKDTEDYMRLGNLVLKINKILAISGPLLTGIAAVGSAFVGSPHGSWAAVFAVAAGALASTVNTLEHGAQVGMVLEMYRFCAGFFSLLEESMKLTLESEEENRESGEMFEMKVALQLGRSISELRDLGKKSSYHPTKETEIDEFASKLF